MANFNCIIVDDEALAHHLLGDYIAKVPQLTMVGGFYSAIDALNFINAGNEVDLMFLDISLPELSGLEMLKVFPMKSNVILITAHAEFAVDAFELGVFDYLLKPIRFERFLKSVNRLIHASHIQPPQDKAKQVHDNYIHIRDNKQFIKLELSKVLYVQGFENYLKVFTKDKSYITNGPLKDVEASLGNEFIRIHRSYLVSKSKITKVLSDSVMIGEIEVPIGSSYQQFFKSNFHLK